MYNKTFWKDHVTEHPDRYKHITNPDGSVEQIPFHGTVQQEGTNQDALHFNNIETGLQHTNIAFVMAYVSTQAYVRELEQRLAVAEAQLAALSP